MLVRRRLGVLITTQDKYIAVVDRSEKLLRRYGELGDSQLHYYLSPLVLENKEWNEVLWRRFTRSGPVYLDDDVQNGPPPLSTAFNDCVDTV